MLFRVEETMKCAVSVYRDSETAVGANAFTGTTIRNDDARSATTSVQQAERARQVMAGIGGSPTLARPLCLLYGSEGGRAKLWLALAVVLFLIALVIVPPLL